MALATEEECETKTMEPLATSGHNTNSNGSNNTATNAPSLEIILPTAFVIKNILTTEEQIELYEAIISTSKVSGQYRPYNKINKNKKYERILDININSVDIREKAKHAKLDVFDKAIQKIFTFILNSNQYNETAMSKDSNYNEMQFEYNYIKAQEYFVPKGYIFNHCDNVKGWVILFSIGCLPKFYVSNKSLIDNNSNPKGEKLIDFESGNVLVFDASRTAGIFHRIDSVVPDTCPIQLSTQFPRLATSRIGLQVRTRGYSSVKNKSKFEDK